MIRLQFSLQDAISSKAIAWFSAGHFSHVDALTPAGFLLGSRSDEVGGALPGVQFRPIGYAPFVKRVIFEVPACRHAERRFWNFLARQVGKPYDHTAILGFMMGRDWREDDSWFCSELQAAALEHAGVFDKLYLAANKITPVSLALAVSAIGGRIV